MDDDFSALRNDIATLASETLALQILLTNLVMGIREAGVSDDILKKVFDISADTAEDLAIKLGPKAQSAHTVEAVRVIEQLRAQIFPGKNN